MNSENKALKEDLQKTINFFLNWMKKNKILTSAIIFGLVIFVIFWQGNKIRSLEDCILQVVKQAKTEYSASIGNIACKDKFPEPNPFMDLPMKK